MLFFGKPVLRWSEPRAYYRSLQAMARKDNLKGYLQENVAFPFLLGFFFGWVFAIGANMAAGNAQRLSEHLSSSLLYGLFFGLACLGIHQLDRLVRPMVSFTRNKIIRKAGRTVERFPLANIDHYSIENRKVAGRTWRCLILFMPKRMVPCTSLVLDEAIDEQSIEDFFQRQNIRQAPKITNEEILTAIETNLY